MAVKNNPTSLKDLKPDSKNARRHTPRNINQISQSLLKVGAARSGVIDEDGNILAGNGTAEALEAVGITKIRVVDAQGDEWVVVRRKGLTAKQKKELSLADNRTAELAEWDVDILKDLSIDVDMDEWFAPDELAHLGLGTIGDKAAPGEFPTYGEDIETQFQCPKCGYEWSGKPS